MALIVDIIKHGGRRETEKYINDKLHRSIVAACLSVHTPEGQAKMNADIVCETVIEWLMDKNEVTSHDIRIVAARKLKIFNPEAAYLYEQNKITI